MSIIVHTIAVNTLPITREIPKSIFNAIAAPINSASAVATAAIPAVLSTVRDNHFGKNS